MSKFQGIDAGWIEGSVVRVTDEMLARDLGLKSWERIKFRWRCQVLKRLNQREATDLLFHVPLITMMGRNGEKRVEY